MNKLKVQLKKARALLSSEGSWPLFRRSLIYLAGFFFQYRIYCLYEDSLKGKNEADYLPKIKNFTLKIVHSYQQADILAASGFEFRSPDGRDFERLERGAIAFCIFIEKELVDICWLAMTQEAQKSLINLPVRVDYAHNEVYVGAAFTLPKYRGLDFLAYGYYRRLLFIREKSKTRCIYLVDKMNTDALHTLHRFSIKPYGEARYLKILWWSSWKERYYLPLSDALCWKALCK